MQIIPEFRWPNEWLLGYTDAKKLVFCGEVT